MMENEEILSKVMQRSEELKLEKIRKTRKIYGVTSIVSSLLIIVTLSLSMPYLTTTTDGYLLLNNANTGTFFSNSSSLGYIMIGLIAFILGIIVTLICYKIKNDNERNSQ